MFLAKLFGHFLEFLWIGDFGQLGSNLVFLLKCQHSGLVYTAKMIPSKIQPVIYNWLADRKVVQWVDNQLIGKT